MKSSHRIKLSHILAGVLVLLVVLAGTSLVVSANTVSDAESLQAVWDRARQSGTYQFSADFTQTNTPLPTVLNAGRQPKETRVYMEGQTDLGAEFLEMTLWSQGGSVMTPDTGAQFKLEGGQAYTRQGGQTWQQVDDFSGAFAPGGDFMTYLVAADNVVRHKPEHRDTPLGAIKITKYTFDINGHRYAEYIRKQLTEQLAAQGELIPGMKLELPKTYAGMTGMGELWVAEDGLPVRQIFDLAFPETTDNYINTSRVVVDFSEFAPLRESDISGTLTGHVRQVAQTITLP